jgi:hypothetical protein
VVEDDDGDLLRGDGGGDLFKLAFADERGRVEAVAVLEELAGDGGTGGDGELAELVERLFSGELGGAGELGGVGGVGGGAGRGRSGSFTQSWRAKLRWPVLWRKRPVRQRVRPGRFRRARATAWGGRYAMPYS